MPIEDAVPNHAPFIAPMTGDQLEQIRVEQVPPNQNKGFMSKKMLMIGGAALAVLLVIGGVFAAMKFRDGGTTPEPTATPTKRRVVEPTNIIPVEERPVVYVIPEADGRNLSLQVDTVKKPATSVEYELEYQAGELLQGVTGALELASLPAKTTQLMGSCSAGGKCSYHEDVRGGTLLLRFLGSENYALKQDWKYIDNVAKETAISSKDAMFQLESVALAKARYLVLYNSPGYPDDAPGTVVSETYALRSSAALLGKGTLTMRGTTEGNIVIAGYDGTTWKEFPGTVEGKMVTAEVDLMQLYVVVSK